MDPVEQWAAHHNRVVDAVAEQANVSRPAAFLEEQEAVRGSHSKESRTATEGLRLHAKICPKAVLHKPFKESCSRMPVTPTPVDCLPVVSCQMPLLQTCVSVLQLAMLMAHRWFSELLPGQESIAHWKELGTGSTLTWAQCWPTNAI